MASPGEDWCIPHMISKLKFLTGYCSLLPVAWRLISVSCCLLTASGHAADAVSRPNILLIVADDLGYTDISAFGSEIRTPNIDEMAVGGLAFTQFYAAPTCSPSRSMMMTGLDNHFTGFGTMTEHLAVNQEGQPGFEGYLNERVVTLPTLLQDAGYHTYLAGKWHIGAKPGMRPSERGFERSFALMNGGAGHFSDMARLLSIYPRTTYLDDGKVVETLPDNFYSSEFYVDKTIEYIESNRADGAPFFAWLAFTAPHWPLQVRDEHLDLYHATYDAGYDEIREERLRAAIEAGLVPGDIENVPRLPRVTPWNELSTEDQQYSARNMEIYAAMVERMDFHIGRIMEYLDETGQADNTIVIFMSDNGAEGNDRLQTLDNATWVPANYDLSYENIGRINSYAFPGPGWAQASSTPLRLFKAYLTEGGIRVPFIVKGPGVAGNGGYTDALATVQDIAPTLLDYIGVEPPGGSYNGREVYSMTGRSIRPLLAGERDTIYTADEALGWELFGHRAIRRGDWKILWADGRNGSDTWQLFNIADDPREVVDLADRYPEKLQELLALWEEYVANNNVILPIGDIGDPN